MLEPLIGFSSFLLAVGSIIYFTNRSRQKQYDTLVASLTSHIKLSLEQVNCKTATFGLKNNNYLFRNCDLYLTEDALIILGYSKDSLLKQLSTPIAITKNYRNYGKFPFLKIMHLKQLKQSDKELFIVFGDAGFTSTNVKLTIEGVSEVDIRTIMATMSEYIS